MRPEKANFRPSDGVHKPDRKFAFSGRIRPRRRHFRLVKATTLVQTVGSANQEIPQFGTPGSTVHGTNCGFGFSTTRPEHVSPRPGPGHRHGDGYMRTRNASARNSY